jgi:hypothetical protein
VEAVRWLGGSAAAGWGALYGEVSLPGGPKIGIGVPTMGPGNQFEFHEQSQAAKQQVFDNALACIPAGWMAATLELKVTGLPGFGPLAIHHRLTNPESGDEVIDFTEDLFNSTSKLCGAFRDSGENWNECVVTMKFDENGKIYKTTIRYNCR